ncbi:EF-hand domain-containing protein [Deinococcus peraridilitoris]|uniref:EF-hand domain-containing protein n=1 Tax=Deinococcus peraridilitoris (strain DSM 19664 / LMG 22246 / CIP 109416 / KR-200) TaxID=937777 RepID=L0A6A2_DEIPD|nr:EF-hand domain-containing protein [Deinococcus peraridilitoris]AFZ68979.1 hypothetical protein Deipe_3549 [Deinococcus peraridilitoris DSM 19664]
MKQSHSHRMTVGAILALGVLTLGLGAAQNRVEPQSIIVVGTSWIETADLSGNGVITYNEFRRVAFNWFIDGDTDANDVINAAEYERVQKAEGTQQRDVVARRTALFRAADRDRDGQIGYYELARLASARFAALDRDKDGNLGPNELSSVRGSFDVAINPNPAR